MKVLLDTCVFIWSILETSKMSKTAKNVFISSESEIFLSSVSIWEIIIKNNLGKLPLPEPPHKLIPDQREKHFITSLPLEEEAIYHLNTLPPVHKDPFDRMLICQAIEHGLSILTPDPQLTQYPIKIIW